MFQTKDIIKCIHNSIKSKNNFFARKNVKTDKT